MAAVVSGSAMMASAVAFGASALAAAAFAGAAALTAVVVSNGARQMTRLSRGAVPGRSTGPHPLPRLMQYARPYRRQIALASACSVGRKLFDITPPLLIGVALDIVLTGGSLTLGALGITSLATQLGTLAGLTAAVFALESTCEFLHKTLWRRIAQQLQHDLRLDAYAAVQGIAMTHLDRESLGEIAVPLTESINQIESFVNDGIDGLLQLTTNTALLVAIYLVVVPNLAWIVALPVPLLVWCTFRYERVSRPLYAAVEEKGALLDKHVVNNVIGLPTIRAFTAEDHETARIRRLSLDYVDANQPAIREFASFVPTFRMPVLASFLGILLAGGASVAAGTLGISTFALALFMVERFLFPFKELGRIVDQYQKAIAAVDRVFAIFNLPGGPASGDQPLPLELVRGEIVFEGVSFSYAGRKDVLSDFSLRIPAGHTVAIVGVTGVGKSTLIKILLRLYEFDSGRVLLDGHDLRDLRTRDLRAALSVVGQDLFLFDGSVRDNIAYGTFDASDEEVQQAARLAVADEFVERLPQRYDTLIGERGARLSAGQRQRLCLARAVLKLKRAPIFLLDEVTSAVDTETETAIQRSLERLSAGRTTLVVAHRLNMVRNAHHIYVLGAQGRVLEQGSHAGLLRKRGYYARMWRVQNDEAALGREAGGDADPAPAPAPRKTRRKAKS
jgi:ATP-binding cassette subfamily B protein